MQLTNLKIGLVAALFLIVGLAYFFSPTLPAIKVMTYSSFLSPYGPAREIEKRFEKECECRVRWVEAEDSTLMIQKLQTRSDGLGIDVVLGLDQITLAHAAKNWKWKNLSIYNYPWIRPAQYWISSWAIPVSWAPFTFISKNPKTPSSFSSLLHKRWKNKISIPHPRFSTVGLQFYFWVYSSMNRSEISKFLRSLKKQIYNMPHSWSASYGLFQRGKSDLTFSYQTSLMYHEIEEKKKYFNSLFKSGHPYQVEYTAIPATCQNCPLAKRFIKFLLKPEIQKILMEKNYMLPVIQKVDSNTPFKKLKNLPLLSYKKIRTFLRNKDSLIKELEKSFK